MSAGHRLDDFTPHSLILRQSSHCQNLAFRQLANKYLVPVGTQAPSAQIRLPDLNAPIDAYNNTYLHIMTANNNRAMVALLLVKGADPSVVNYGGITPLRMAQTMRFDEIVMMLKKHRTRTDYIGDVDLRVADDILLSEAMSGMMSIMSTTITSAPASTSTKPILSGRSERDRAMSVGANESKMATPVGQCMFARVAADVCCHKH